MLDRAKVTLCYEINPKHTIIMCGQNVQHWILNVLVYQVTMRLEKFQQVYDVGVIRLIHLF
jgi:hypothetical protein